MMTHLKVKTFWFVFLIIAISGAVQIQAYALANEGEENDGVGDTDETTPIETNEDIKDLEKLQAERANAYNEYFSALGSAKTKADERKLEEKILAPVHEKFSTFLHEQKKKENDELYGKIYFGDGRIVKISDYAAQLKEEEYLDQTAIDEILAPDGPEDGKEDKNYKPEDDLPSDDDDEPAIKADTKNLKTDVKNDDKKNELVLDGKDIPKEITFEGKRTNKKSAAKTIIKYEETAVPASEVTSEVKGSSAEISYPKKTAP
ncbi:MAG: hypothetical protein AABZ06_05240 [Bdellovibrionota bacterium]